MATRARVLNVLLHVINAQYIRSNQKFGVFQDHSKNPERASLLSKDSSLQDAHRHHKSFLFGWAVVCALRLRLRRA